jgi:Undecaprenyl-phosphate glucose phosphotransferase
MMLLRRDAGAAGARPPRLSALRPETLLPAWDVTGIVVTGLACRGLNPAGHAGHTMRELIVILATALLGVTVLRLRGFHGAEKPGRLGLLFTLLQTFALMLLALLVWEEASALYRGTADAGADAILVVNRNWLFSWAIAAPALLLLTRPSLDSALLRAAPPVPRRRAVMLGDAACAARLGRVMQGRGAVEVLGFLDIRPRTGRVGLPPMPPDWPRLGSLRDARSLLASGEADLLLIALPETAEQRIAAIERLMAGVAADIWLAPDAARLYAADARLSALGGLPFLHLRDKPMAGPAAVLKRAEDLALGLPLLVLAVPPMLIIGIAVRLSSPGPALFIQPRLGLNRRIIHVRKFRTMRMEAADATGARQAVSGDARVTGLGRFLRSTSLDELPQLLNVVEGTMSLVGPRPHAAGTKAAGLLFGEAAQGYAARHRVKPGMTGWAQVRGWRGETDTVEKLRRRVEHDLFYIAHWSLWLDLRILAMTARSVLRGEGV